MTAAEATTDSKTSEGDLRLALTMLAATAVLMKGAPDDELIQAGDFLHGLTGDLMDMFFADEKAGLMRSIEMAFDEPLAPGFAVESVEKKVLIDFVRGINMGDKTALALLDAITQYLNQEAEERAADNAITLGEVDEVVRSIATDPPPDGESVREITGPNGERIIMRIISGYAAEPDEDDPERHDTAEDDDHDGAVRADAEEAGRLDREAEGGARAEDGEPAEG